MKAGLATSLTLHAALLGFGLVSLSAPRAFEVADVEALPVDIVPISSLTQIQEGDRTAPKSERAAPKPTERQDPVENAERVGDNDTDVKAPPTPQARPKPVEQTAEPPPSPQPAPKPDPKPAPDTQKAQAEPVPVPATEVRPEPTPRQDVAPDPVAETIEAQTAEAESLKLPDTAPVPQARPEPPKAQTAKAPERKDADKPSQNKQASTPKSENSQKLLDEVAALLNREKASGGGAKRSNEQASLGGRNTTSGNTLSQSEMDALRGQIQRCWNVPAAALDAENLKVSIQMKLDPSGAVDGSPRIISGGSSAMERAAAESARRAVLQCAPYTLPAEKYDSWADVIVHFDPSDMF